MTPQEAELERSKRMFAQKVDRIRKSADKLLKELKEIQHDLILCIAAMDDLEEAKEPCEHKD